MKRWTDYQQAIDEAARLAKERKMTMTVVTHRNRVDKTRYFTIKEGK